MPVPPASNENVALREDPPGGRTRAEAEPCDAPVAGLGPEPGGGSETNEPLPVAGADVGVGLTQKGVGEDAVVARETEI